jgi:hypothetical protein
VGGGGEKYVPPNQNINVSKTILFYFLDFSTNWKCFSEIKNENIGDGDLTFTMI